MKIKLKYNNREELKAYLAISLFKGQLNDIPAGNSLEKFTKLNLQELRERLLKKSVLVIVNNSQKGNISISKAELYAIEINMLFLNDRPYELAVYHKNIFPLLNLIA